MSDKTLGQVAYEAWALQLVHTYPPTTKHELLGTDSRHAWQAAAEAVAMEEAKRLRNSGMAGDATKAERKVIEAAKHLAVAVGNEHRAITAYAVAMVVGAVEALQEVEGGL